MNEEQVGDALGPGKGEARLHGVWVLTRDLSAPWCLEELSLQDSLVVGCGRLRHHFSGPPRLGLPRPFPQHLFTSLMRARGSPWHALVPEKTRWSAQGGPPVLAQNPGWAPTPRSQEPAPRRPPTELVFSQVLQPLGPLLPILVGAL